MKANSERYRWNPPSFEVQRNDPYFMYDMNVQSVPTLVDNKEVTETTTEENNETDDSDNDLLLRIIFKKWQ